MTHVFTQKLGVCSLAAAMTVGMSVPGFAAERSTPAPSRQTLLASGQKQVQQLAMVTTPAVRTALANRAQQEGTGGSGYDTPGSFFKTKRGAAILVLAGAGIGYMWYSKVNDRIHSDARARADN